MTYQRNMSRVIRSYFDGSLNNVGQEFTLSSDESYHLQKVLRKEVGDTLEILDGMGGVGKAVCIEKNDKNFRVRIDKIETKPLPIPLIRMLVSLTKGGRWENIIKPLTELGVNRITPLLTDRTEVRKNENFNNRKLEKWKKLAIEACKQSGNLWLPKIDPPELLSDYLCEPKKSSYMASLAGGEMFFKLDQGSSNIDILIGPEGGWTPQEEELAGKFGVSCFSMGNRTLRAETAAVSSLAVAQSKFLS
jgi:16S rRNA (uracil1498-N3)-methyltransferase